MVCRREVDEFRVPLRGDRTVTGDFDINGGETLADTFPRGLTFLAPDVRSEIAVRIEDARLARTDFSASSPAPCSLSTPRPSRRRFGPGLGPDRLAADRHLSDLTDLVHE